MVRFTASRKLIWPDTILSQVGLLASSKSAIKALAPELRALMIILRSVGPVISTRRSCKSSGIGEIFQLLLRSASVSDRKWGRQPASSCCCVASLSLSRRSQSAPKRRCNIPIKSSASVVRISAYSAEILPRTLIPFAVGRFFCAVAVGVMIASFTLSFISTA